MSISENKLVVQHNKIVEARYRLSVGEQRIIKLLISMIKKDDKDFKAYKISVKQLSELLEITDNDFHRKIKAISKKLLSNVLTFKNIDDDEELQVSWLSSAKYIGKEGVVELEFSPTLKPFLLLLKNNMTYYQLGNVIHLKHTYSIRLYELLKQYEKLGKRKFDIQTLRSTLGIAENEYQQFSDFRKRILKAAQQELTEKTDIAFIWEEEKKAQKCLAITFFIIKQNRLQPTEEEKEERLVFEVEAANIGKAEPALNGLAGRLVAMGVTRSTAVQLTTEYEAVRLERAIAYTLERQKEGVVKNAAAFVVTAIKKDYIDALAEEKRKKAEAMRLKKEQASLKKQWLVITARYNGWKTGAVEAALSVMTGDEADSHRRQFEQSPTYEALKAIFKSKATLERHFLIYLRVQLPFDTLEEWAQKNGVDLSGFSDEVRLG